jgi:dTDP-4-amino-4,6-dideoxygalactose transaminase
LAYAWALRGTEKRVLVPDMTFVATANAAVVQGGELRLFDIAGGQAPVADPQAARAALAERGGRAAAVTVVHYAGFDAAAAEFAAIAREGGALLVEDNAHGVGGRAADGRMLGTVGDIGVLSFFSNKNLATGEGGMVVTDSDECAAAVRGARSHGMSSLTYERHAARRHGYDVGAVGHNFRCTEITAALGIEQLRKLEAGNTRRRSLYRLYRDQLAGVPGVAVAFGNQDEAIARSSCHILPLVCATSGLRDAVREALDASGIQSSHHYGAIHAFSAYRRMAAAAPEGCPASADFAAREITLPLHPRLAESDVDEICSVVRKVATSH